MAFCWNKSDREWPILYDFTHRICKKLNLEKERHTGDCQRRRIGEMNGRKGRRIQTSSRMWCKVPYSTFLAQRPVSWKTVSTDPGEDGSGGKVSDGEQLMKLPHSPTTQFLQCRLLPNKTRGLGLKPWCRARWLELITVVV